jgi:hypothetical protein
MSNLLRTLAALIVFCATAAAQDRIQRFEAGADFTYLRLHTPASVVDNRLGFGGRFTFNFNQMFALDSEWSTSPSDNTTLFGQEFAGGRSNEIFAGIKAGGRIRRYGIFMKLRPGLITAGNVVKTLDFNSFALTTGRRIDPLLDAGGVLEFYPSKHWILRYDLSDTIIFYGDTAKVINLPPPLPTEVRGSGNSTQNFRFTAGISYRF